MKKMILGVLVGLIWLGSVTISSGQVQPSPLKVTLVLDRAAYLLEDRIKLAITFENTTGAGIITTRGFLDRPFHLFLRFVGPDGKGILANDINDTQGEDIPPLRGSDQVVQIEPVEILPTVGDTGDSRIFSLTLPNAHTFYTLTTLGEYKVTSQVAFRAYPAISQTITGVDYAHIDTATFADTLASNTVRFALVEPIDFCATGDKPQVLTMQYTGKDCSASSNDQDPSLTSCTGDPAFTSPVFVKVTDRSNPDHKQGIVWFEGQVGLDRTFNIDATTAGLTRLKGNTFVHIFTADQATLLQRVQFHTSCSVPLKFGDQFGSLRLEGFIPE